MQLTAINGASLAGGFGKEKRPRRGISRLDLAGDPIYEARGKCIGEAARRQTALGLGRRVRLPQEARKTDPLIEEISQLARNAF